ncbi:MAG TPA: hypothetical protein VFQ45_04610 [Longimicrobium sp.]|nr:hypothetical protein [Longimicrobium sp.]
MSIVLPAAEIRPPAHVTAPAPARHAGGSLLRSVRELLPFTYEFRSAVQAEIERRVRRFRSLHALDPAVREALAPRVRRFESALVPVLMRKRGALAGVLWTSVALLVLSWVVLVPLYAPGALAQGEARLHARAALAAGVLLPILAAAMYFVSRRLRRWASRRAVARAMLVLCALIYLSWVAAVSDLDPARLTADFAQALGMVALYGIALVVLGGAAVWWTLCRMERWYERHACARHPDAMMVREMVSMLAWVEEHPHAWSDLRARGRILRSLETVAYCLERQLVRHLRGHDAATERWLREKTAQRAAAVRALKRWVCLPKADTRERFVERIAGDLVRAATGDWDGLESAEVEAAGPSPVRRLAGASASAAVIAVLYVALPGAPDLPFDLAGASALVPFAPVLGPMLGFLLLRIFQPGLIADLPAVKQLGEMMGKR